MTGLNSEFSNYHFNPSQTGNGYYGVTTNPNDESLGDALTRGFLNVSGQATMYQTILAYQYGLTDHLSVGIMLPYVRYDVTINAGISGPNTMQDIYDAFSSSAPPGSTGLSPGQQTVLDQLRSYLSQLSGITTGTLQSFLQSRGYQTVSTDSIQSGFGDMVLGGRYLYFDRDAASGHWLSSVQAGVTVPTGSMGDPSVIGSQNLGQGAWQLGVADIINYSPNHTFMFSGGLHLNQPFVSSRTMRVEADPTDIIPDSADTQDVTVHLGASAQLTLGARAAITDYLSLDSGYSWWWKGIDTYEGSRNIDYTYLSNDTFEYEQMLNLGVNLSSVERFLQHKALLPGDLGVSVFVPTRGLNVPVAPYGMAQIAMYF